MQVLSNGQIHQNYSFISAGDEVAMLEPLGVAHNAVERLEVGGEDVLIIGCGPVGLLALLVAKAMGCKRLATRLFDN